MRYRLSVEWFLGKWVIRAYIRDSWFKDVYTHHIVAGPFATRDQALDAKRSLYEVSKGQCNRHSDCREHADLAAECLKTRPDRPEFQHTLKKANLFGWL